MLAEARSLVLSQHLYQADALQIVTCNGSKSKLLITSDELLRRACEELGLKALDPYKQERDLEDLFG
jgi:predicted nucleic acid-binding protein